MLATDEKEQRSQVEDLRLNVKIPSATDLWSSNFQSVWGFDALTFIV